MALIDLHYKFTPLVESKSRYFIVSGGRGSAKSFSIATYLLLKTFEKGQVILFSRLTMMSALISVIPEFNSKIEALGIESLFHITNNEIINKTSGSRIIFKGLKTGSKVQTANIKGIEGLTIFVLDEAEELVDEELFNKINFTVRTKNASNQVILVFNPATKSHWLYNRWFKKAGVQPGSNLTKGRNTYIHTTYLDNLENLSQDFIDEMEGMKLTNPAMYNNVVMGGFKDKAEGLILKNWKLGKFPVGVPSEFALDFGFSNDPTALAECHIDHAKKILYVKGHLYKTGIIPSELAKIVKGITGNSLIVADSASPDVIAELKSAKCNITGVKKPKIIDRLELLRDYTIVVDPESKDIIEELNNYCWDSNYPLGDRPIDDFNHYIDGINYYVVHRQRNKQIKRFRIR